VCVVLYFHQQILLIYIHTAKDVSEAGN